MTADQTIRVALSSGIFVRHDAISNSVDHKLQILTELQAEGLPVEATVFTHGSDRVDPRVRTIDSVEAAIRLPEFEAADLHIFEYGITYPLFNAVFLLDRPLVGVYHNLTPPQLVVDAPVREAMERSLIQKHNLARLDHVSCVSEINYQDLVEFGIPAERLSVLPLPARPEVERARPVTAVERREGPVELLYVGRFVHAKGVLDLVDAVRRLAARGVGGFRVTLAGNLEHSSPDVVRELRAAEGTAPTSGLVRIVPTPSDTQLAELYGRADAVVLPSYHEGFCVPVVEALSMGCQVIASDAGNIPSVLGGLGRIVPAGDVEALADAIADWVARVQAQRTSGGELLHPTAAGDVPDEVWRARVQGRAERYSFPAYRRGFLRLLHLAASLLREGSPRWLAEAAGTTG